LVPSRKRADRQSEGNSPYLPNDRLDPRAPKRLRPRRPSPSEFLTASRPSSSHWTDSPEFFARARRYPGGAARPVASNAPFGPTRTWHPRRTGPELSFRAFPSRRSRTSLEAAGSLAVIHDRPRRLLMATRRLAASRATAPKLPARTETRAFPFGNPSGDVCPPASPASELSSLRKSVHPTPANRAGGRCSLGLLSPSETHPRSRILEPIPAVTDRARLAPRAPSTPPSPQASRTTPPAPS
jgi:hypothetical protein